MLSRFVMFLLRTYFFRVVLRKNLRRMQMRLRDALSLRNILGESVGLWWDMRKLR